MHQRIPANLADEPVRIDAEGAELPGRKQVRPKIEKRLPSNRTSWAVLVGLLTFAPLSFGAVEFWSIALVELLAVVLVVSWLIGAVRRGELHVQLNSLAWAALGLQVWVTLQLLLRRTLDRAITRESLWLLFSYFLVFIVVTNEQWSARWIRRLAAAIASIGFGIAVFGIAQSLTWNGKLYWIRPIHEGAPFGPYVNHDHFAGLMEMTFAVAMGLVFSQRLAPIWRVLFAFFAVVMASATLLSLSRGGMLGLALGMVTFIYLFARRRGARRILITGSLLGALVAAWLMWLGAGPVVDRVFNLRELHQEASFQSRLVVAKDTLGIIREHPFTGTGLGTFPLAIPHHLSFYTDLSWDKAHNDYVQLLSEVGLIGFSFTVWWIVGLFRSVLKRVWDSSVPLSTLRLGAFCGCLSLLIHSFADFNLQIPANALFFTVLAALATRQNSVHAAQGRSALDRLPIEGRAN
jgi:hypothetical protein